MSQNVINCLIKNKMFLFIIPSLNNVQCDSNYGYILFVLISSSYYGL